MPDGPLNPAHLHASSPARSPFMHHLNDDSSSSSSDDFFLSPGEGDTPHGSVDHSARQSVLQMPFMHLDLNDDEIKILKSLVGDRVAFDKIAMCVAPYHSAAILFHIALLPFPWTFVYFVCSATIAETKLLSANAERLFHDTEIEDQINIAYRIFGFLVFIANKNTPYSSQRALVQLCTLIFNLIFIFAHS